MKKLSRAAAAAAALAMLSASFGGCSGTDVGESGNDGAADSGEGQTQSALSEDGGTVTADMRSYGATVTVSDIKSAYGESDDDSVMPLYNVAQDESFTFTFNFDCYETDIGLYDYVSVHTDSACAEESAIYYTADLDSDGEISTLTISPMAPVLETDSQEEAYVYEDEEIWGNAPIYYIAIHYDMESGEPEKLENPIIVPFTVYQEVEAPNVKGVVDESGRLKLTWDPVEGAEKYIVYKLTNGSLWTGENNEPLNGAQTGYSELSLVRDYETTETEYDNFAGEGHGLAEITNNSGTYNINQNCSVCGDYYVSAVVDGKESGFNAPVSTADLSLPYKVVEEEDILFERCADISEMPSTMNIINIDGTVSERNVQYTRKDDGVDLFGNSRIEYWYTIEGTALTGYVVLDETDDTLPDEIGEDSNAGNAVPEDDINKLPDSDVDTIIPVDPSESGSGADENDPEEGEDEEEQGLIDQQQENTQDHIEHGNEETVANAPDGVYVNADSAEEEWLALNLISANTEISVEAFPSLQDPYTLTDTFYKVYYQNPYVMGVNAFSYDYQTFTMNVYYTYDAETIADMQSQTAGKGGEIIDSVISEDMSDQDKTLALYDYLVANSVYDDDALAAAEESGYTKTDGFEYEDSFNAYGVLVNGKGVCMSYAYAFRLLCDLSGVECVVVTGYLSGNLPHAWNMVKLDGEWYEIDCTNNAVNTGIPYFLYESDTSLAEETGFSKDDLFALDSELEEYNGEDDSKEYYKSNGLMPSTMDELKTAITSGVTADTQIFAVRWSGDPSELTADADGEFAETVRLAFNELGFEDKLENTGFVYQYGFIVLVIE